MARYLKDVELSHFRMDQSNRFLVLLLSVVEVVVVMVALLSVVTVQNVLVQDLVDTLVHILLIDMQVSKNGAEDHLKVILYEP